MQTRIVVPKMRLPNPLNSREHWRKTHQRNNAHTYELELVHGTKLIKVELPCTITLIRCGPKLLDDDGVAPSMKHIRDYLADQLLPTKKHANQHGRRADDSDPLITWKYSQVQGEYGLVIEIERVLSAHQERTQEGAHRGPQTFTYKGVKRG